MLDGPECYGGFTTDPKLAKVGRRRIKRLAELCFLDARGKMATDAHGVVVAGADTNQVFILEVRYLDVSCAYLNGAIPSHDQKCMHCREMRIVSADVDQAKVSCTQYPCTGRGTRYYERCNCSFHVRLSKPHADTGNETRFIHIPTLIADEVCGLAVGAAPGDAYVGCELTDDFIP